VLRTNRNRLRQFKQLRQRYWQLAHPYWFSDEKWNAFGILILLTVLIISTTSLSGTLNELSGKFIKALSNKELEYFDVNREN
jgi:vitamin B12/bleomycin/antimicrobial peptide transport system ATP-binding/permease protein